MAYNGEEGSTKLVDLSAQKNKKIKKLLIIVVGVVALLISIALITKIIIDKRKSPSDATLNLTDDQIRIRINDLNNARFKDISDKANKINTPQDLSKYSPDESMNIGSVAMSNMYAAGQYDKLKPIAESFSEKGGSIAIDALRYLYIIEKDTTKKAIWLDKLNVEARKQGIIGGSESLPESYLIIKDGQ